MTASEVFQGDRLELPVARAGGGSELQDGVPRCGHRVGGRGIPLSQTLLQVARPVAMAGNPGGIRLTLSGRNLRLHHSAPPIAKPFKQASGGVVGACGPQMGIHRDNPGTPDLIDRHRNVDLPLNRTSEQANQGPRDGRARAPSRNQ